MTTKQQDIIDGIMQRATGPAITIHEAARLSGGFISHRTLHNFISRRE